MVTKVTTLTTVPFKTRAHVVNIVTSVTTEEVTKVTKFDSNYCDLSDLHEGH